MLTRKSTVGNNMTMSVGSFCTHYKEMTMKKGVAMIRGVCTYCTEQIDLKLHILPTN